MTSKFIALNLTNTVEYYYTLSLFFVYAIESDRKLMSKRDMKIKLRTRLDNYVRKGIRQGYILRENKGLVRRGEK